MNKSFLRLTASLITATALALLAATQAVAQDDEPMWTQLRTVHVKPGRNAEFAELQKELGAALKAADRPPRLIYQEIRGDVGVFHVLARAADLAEFDTPFVPPMSDKAWTDWLARYQGAIDSST